MNRKLPFALKIPAYFRPTSSVMSRSLARCYHLLCHWSCHALKAVPERSHSWNLRPYACVYIYIFNIYYIYMRPRMAFYIFTRIWASFTTKTEKMPGLIRDWTKQNRKAPVFTRQKRIKSLLAVQQMWCVPYLLIVFHSQQGKRPFFPQVVAPPWPVRWHLSTEQTSPRPADAWGKCCGIWCHKPKEKSQGEKSGKELGSTYLLRLDFLSRHFWKRSEVLHDQIEVGEGGEVQTQPSLSTSHLKEHSEDERIHVYQNLDPEGRVG